MKEVKEDLPQASTFKKWMKKLKIWGLAIIILVIISTIATGVLGYKLGEESKKDVLTLKTIVNTFKKQGLILKKDGSKSPEKYEIKGVKPAVYSIGKSNDTLLIYTFKSFSERKKILEESGKFNTISLEEIPYKAKNALIVFVPYKWPETEKETESFGEVLNSISSAVFKNLNNDKERVYKGESESWEGTFTLEYYENRFEDEEGEISYVDYDRYKMTYHIIKYKMSDIKAVGPIIFEYKTSYGGGRSEGLTLNEEGHARAGGSGGNGAIPDEDEEINFTIRWRDKEEHMVLKAEK